MAVEHAVADTSVFIAREAGRALRTEAIPPRLTVSTITIGELRAGVLAAGDRQTSDVRLGTLLWAMEAEPAPVDHSVAAAWANLRMRLRDAGQRMPVNDSWIAATAMALDVPVVTQDDDYDSVPGLTVIKV